MNVAIDCRTATVQLHDPWLDRGERLDSARERVIELAHGSSLLFDLTSLYHFAGVCQQAGARLQRSEYCSCIYATIYLRGCERRMGYAYRRCWRRGVDGADRTA